MQFCDVNVCDYKCRVEVEQLNVECCRMQNDVKLPAEQRRKSVYGFIRCCFRHCRMCCFWFV